MLTWTLMRHAAICRHFWWNVLLEDGDAHAWDTHMRIIRAVYGR